MDVVNVFAPNRNRIAVFSFRFHLQRSCCVCVVLTWLALSVSLSAKENRTDHETRFRERLLQQAENYWNSVDQAASPRIGGYLTVVRGLLLAGFSPDHPFLHAKIDILLRIAPRDRDEAARQREIVLLRSLGRQVSPFMSERDISSLQAVIVSDYYNENFRRFGVVRLPHGSDPDRPHQPSMPENEAGHLLVAASVSSSAFRPFEVGDLTESSLDSVASSHECRRDDTDRQPSFVLIAKTIRLQV